MKPTVAKKQNIGIPVALIIVAGLLAYANSFSGVFVFDDLLLITKNPRIWHLFPIREYFSEMPRPTVSLTFTFNYWLGRLNPWGYHLLNLVIHLLAALTLFGIIHRTLARLKSFSGNSARWLALCVSLLWVVHPLQTQSVTYIIQRDESLMGLFYLLTLYCAIRFAESPQQRQWGIGSIFSCALGMGCKPVMVTAPLTGLLYDRIFLESSFSQIFRKRGGFYAGLAATWLFLAVLLMAIHEPAHTHTVGFSMKNLSPLQYAVNQPQVIWHYLRLAFCPHPLIFDYAWPVAKSLRTLFLPALGIAFLLLAILWGFRRYPKTAFLGASFFLLLAPTSSFVPIADLMYEYRMYLPLAPLIALVVMGGYHILRTLFPSQPNLRKTLAAALVGIAAVLASLLTFQRNKVYHDDITLWSDVVAKRPDSARAHCNLGVALQDRGGAVEKAAWHFREALRLNPEISDGQIVYNNLGICLLQLEQVDEAITQFQQSLKMRPDFADTYVNLANALVKKKQYTEAISACNQAIRLDPALAQAYLSMGNVYLYQGKPNEAKTFYTKAVQLKPDYAEAHNNLGSTLALLGNLDEAIIHFKQAIQINPRHTSARENLSLALQQKQSKPSP